MKLPMGVIQFVSIGEEEGKSGIDPASPRYKRIRGGGCAVTTSHENHPAGALQGESSAELPAGTCSVEIVISVQFKQLSFCLGNSSDFIHPCTTAVFRETLCK